MIDRHDGSSGGPSRAFPMATDFWLRLSIVAAMLSAAGSVVGLAIGDIYAPLTPVFLPQALAQDLANLLLVAPAWLVLATLARRGSLRAYLLWLGVLAFTVYNYVIYTFSIPFGPLFLPWVAVLGISLYALIGGIATLDHEAVAAAFTSRRAVVVAGWLLMVMAILFGLLWLSEDVPALRAGLRPQSLVDMALPTNPVHILDLAFFLPAVLMVGLLLLRRRPLAHSLAPPLIAFLVLTGVPILLTPAVQAARGAAADWSVALPIGSLTVAMTALLAWLLATVREDARAGGDAADDAPAAIASDASPPTPIEVANLALLRSYLAALEAGAVGDALARFFTADAEQVELPNRLNPGGGRSDLATMLARAEQGRKLLTVQRYVIHRMVAHGSEVAVEAEWTGVLAVALGSLSPGAEMRAHFAMFFDIENGRIRTQRNYDCFEPW
jgi:ketosteroid isomerase-like protein